MELFYYLVLSLAVTGAGTLWLALGPREQDELTDAEREALDRRVRFLSTGRG